MKPSSPPSRCIFITSSPPRWGTQSGPVILRHLLRLREERTVICVSFQPTPADYPLEHIALPLRLPWFMPVRRYLPLSDRINRWQKVSWLRRRLSVRADDKLVICLHSTTEHLIARDLALRTRASLIALLHDRWPEDSAEEITRTLRVCHHVLAVSQPLATLAARHTRAKVSRLYPLGEDVLPPPAPPAEDSCIGVAGSLGPEYLEHSCRLGLPVLALGWTGADRPGVIAVEKLPQNLDALRLLQSRCRALVVCQFAHQTDYATYGFPSRLIDFAQTGLPLVLIAEPDTNLGRWAAEKNWRLWIRCPRDEAAYREITLLLKNPQDWTAESARTRACALGEFHAAHIHADFLAALA